MMFIQPDSGDCSVAMDDLSVMTGMTPARHIKPQNLSIKPPQDLESPSLCFSPMSPEKEGEIKM